MRASLSIWSRYVNRLFGTARTISPLRSARHRLRSRENAPLCAAAEVLELRALLSAPSFASVVGIAPAAQDVATDQGGNAIMTGGFSGTVDFDPAAPSAPRPSGSAREIPMPASISTATTSWESSPTVSTI